MEDAITITRQEYIELLEYKLDCLTDAQEKDSSWNYGIEELKEQIQQLRG